MTDIQFRGWFYIIKEHEWQLVKICYDHKDIAKCQAEITKEKKRLDEEMRNQIQQKKEKESKAKLEEEEEEHKEIEENINYKETIEYIYKKIKKISQDERNMLLIEIVLFINDLYSKQNIYKKQDQFIRSLGLNSDIMKRYTNGQTTYITRGTIILFLNLGYNFFGKKI